MALPKKLKNFNVFVDGISQAAVAQELTLPKLAIKTEDYRGGGMNGPVEVDLGLQKLELEVTYGGFVDALLASFGSPRIEATMLRFAGAYQSDDNGAVKAVEVTVRGRHTEIDAGKAQSGEKTEHKFKTALNYYKLTVDGKTVIEIDQTNFVFKVNGIDRLAEQRAAIGL